MNNKEIKTFIKEQLNTVRIEDSQKFQKQIIESIYSHLEGMGYKTNTIKTLIDEAISNKIIELSKKIKGLLK